MQSNEPPKAKKHKSLDSDEDNEEPRNESGTSSNTQPAASVLCYNFGDEDSEYSDKFRKDFVPPRSLLLTNDEHWTMTLETQLCSNSRIILLCDYRIMEINRTYAI